MFFKNLLLSLVAKFITPDGLAKVTKQVLGTKRGTDAVAHAAPILGVIADAAGNAAVVQINKAAATGGDVAKVAAAVQAAQSLGVKL